jgi:hypothetical protein
LIALKGGPYLFERGTRGIDPKKADVVLTGSHSTAWTGHPPHFAKDLARILNVL